jgi:tRNA 2-thiouridine synthesizing protein E
MGIDADGKNIETTPSGFLVNIEDWNEAAAKAIADEENLELTDKHWDVVNYLRNEYINNGENQPNTRNIVKAMAKAWGDKKLSAKVLYDLFPGNPSKQAGRIGGLPESRRKGGY